MAHAYTPGLLVTEVTTIKQRRILPIKGDVLVKVGDRVAADQVVARTFMPGDVHPINLANQLSLPPQDVPECVLKKVGDEVKEGEPLARTKGVFGLFKSEYKSPVFFRNPRATAKVPILSARVAAPTVISVLR